jgi:hypothetical protein
VGESLGLTPSEAGLSVGDVPSAFDVSVPASLPLFGCCVLSSPPHAAKNIATMAVANAS